MEERERQLHRFNDAKGENVQGWGQVQGTKSSPFTYPPALSSLLLGATSLLLGVTSLLLVGLGLLDL